MKRRTAFGVCDDGMAMLAGGSDDDDRAGDFDSRLRAGAPCSELFAIRNELDPYSNLVSRMNGQLRGVGCHDISSERTD